MTFKRDNSNERIVLTIYEGLKQEKVSEGAWVAATRMSGSVLVKSNAIQCVLLDAYFLTNTS